MDDLAYTDSMIKEIQELLTDARQRVAAQANTKLLSTYWNIGRIIIDFPFPIFSLCAAFIRPIRFNRRCLLN